MSTFENFLGTSRTTFVLAISMTTLLLVDRGQGADEAPAGWSRHTIDESSRGADGVRLADVNGDGRLDIATGWEEGGVVRAYLQPEPEKVREPWPSVTVGRVKSAEDAVFVDLDSDGAVDVVSSSEGRVRTMHVHWAPLEKSRYLDESAWKTEAIPVTKRKQSWMFCVPFDVDGKNGIDLVVGSKGRGAAVGWLESPKDPRALGEWKYHKLRDAGWIMSIRAFDVDGDRKTDLVVSDRRGPGAGIFWLKNPGVGLADGGGTASEAGWIERPIAPRIGEAMFLDVGDWDGDGQVDVTCAVKGRGYAHLESTSAAHDIWTKPEWIRGGGRAGTPKGTAMGDIDGDGRGDLVFSCENAARGASGVRWLSRESTAAGPRWTPHEVSGAPGVKFDRLELVDLDGDGALDILTCEERDNLGVIWYENPHGAPPSSSKLTLRQRTRVETTPGSKRYHTVVEEKTWDAHETAIIVCDMWQRHWCKGSTRRVEQMAPRMNEVLESARKKGVLIVHAPSSGMKFYENTPSRKLAKAAPKAADLPKNINKWCDRQDGRDADYPIDQSDGGCDTNSEGRTEMILSQVSTLEIEDVDAISDSGEEIWNLFASRDISNVILMGVHTNMCVLGRPFGIRNLVLNGKNVVLARDLTDTMYNPERAPYVSHFTGNDLIVEHIEKNWCPTITSTDFLGGEPSSFPKDERKHLAIVMAEAEYRTYETLTKYAREMLGKDFRVSFVYANEKNRDDLPGIEILDEADFAIFSIRRRLISPKQMSHVRRFFESGKPLVAIRTTSHAFAASGGKRAPAGKAEWIEFDRDILGGNYTGHHGNKGPNAPKTLVRIVDAVAQHPILRDVRRDEFVVRSWLYKTSPLGGKTKVLMMGRVEGREKPEPVSWTNEYGQGSRVFYTSLGHPADFEMPAFRLLLANGIYWAAGLEVPKSSKVGAEK